MCYVYILKCADGSYYTGYTPDLCRRMRAHVSGKGSKYTHAHPPAALAAIWRCEDAAAARRLEYAIKKQLSRSEKEQLIAAQDTVNGKFPQLEGLHYEPLSGVTLEDCLEGKVYG